MEKKKLCLNTRLVCADAAGVIDALAEGLKERCLRLQKGDETLVLTPPEAVDLELEAKLKDGRGKITLEISWRVAGDDAAESADEDDEDAPTGEEEILIDAAELAAEELAAEKATGEQHSGAEKKTSDHKKKDKKDK